MADLTPEQLDQLEQDVAGWPGGGVHCDALMYVPLDAPPPDDRDFRDHAYLITEDIDWNPGESLARLLNAVPALVAAAKERDQLRTDVEKLRAAKPLLIHIDRDGESLCGMELHHGSVPLTAERSEVTCVGCWILRDEEAVQMRAIIDAIADAMHDATPWAVEDRGAVALRLAKQFSEEIDRLHALEGAQLEQRAAEHSAAWEQHLQAHIGQQAKEIGQLHATIERIKAFVADHEIINDIELESILKGETP